MKITCIVVLALSALALPAAGPTHAAPVVEPTELLVNGSFESWQDDQPTGWTIITAITEGDGPRSVLAAGPDHATGEHSLRLSGADSTQQWAGAMQTIAVEPGDVFRFSGWFRSTAIERGRHRNGNHQAAVMAKAANGKTVNMWVLGKATGSTGWTHDEAYLQAPFGCATLEVSGFLSVNGTLEIDDLSLRQLALPVPTPDAPREDRWRNDIAYLADLLPRLHVNPFTMITEAEFRSRTADLGAAVGGLTDQQLNLRLMALVTSLGDAHSAVGFVDRPRRLPIQFEAFGDELRVLAVDRRCADLAGGRVVKIGSTDVAGCLDAVRPLIACETESWFRHQAPQMLRLAEVVHGVGLSPLPDRVDVTVIAEDGQEKTCTVALPAPGEHLEFDTREPAEADTPLYLSGRANYWYEYLADERTFYLQYNRCREDPQRPMATFTREVATFLDEHPVHRFVLDVRANRGGSSGILDSLIGEVATRHAAGTVGRCYVITGCATFSAACLNTLDFREAADAMVVGEPMGNKPNRFGQANVFTLPNTGIQVQYATKHFVKMEGDPPALVPDLPVVTTWDDYLSGRDPALKRILADGL